MNVQSHIHGKTQFKASLCHLIFLIEKYGKYMWSGHPEIPVIKFSNRYKKPVQIDLKEAKNIESFTPTQWNKFLKIKGI